jgi:hypothetical protein
MSDQPQPKFDFQWNFTFPKMFEGSVKDLSDGTFYDFFCLKEAIFCLFSLILQARKEERDEHRSRS